MTQAKLTVQQREVSGKKVKSLRQQGLTIANVIVANEPSVAVQAPQKTVSDLLNEVGESTVITLSVDGEKATRPVLLDEVQLNPVTQDIQHVTFKQVNLKEKVSAEVPVEIVGEVDIPESVLVTVRDAVEVEALPMDLPENFEVDISTLTEIGQGITVADLTLKSGVELVLGDDQDPSEMMIVMVQAQAEEEEEPAEDELAEGEAGETTESETGEEASTDDAEDSSEETE